MPVAGDAEGCEALPVYAREPDFIRHTAVGERMQQQVGYLLPLRVEADPGSAGHGERPSDDRPPAEVIQLRSGYYVHYV